MDSRVLRGKFFGTRPKMPSYLLPRPGPHRKIVNWWPWPHTNLIIFYQDLTIDWNRPVARIDLGGCRTPKSGLFGPKKWTFLNLTPLPSYKNPHFWPTLWQKVDLLADFGPHPPGYGPGLKQYHEPKLTCFKLQQTCEEALQWRNNIIQCANQG